MEAAAAAHSNLSKGTRGYERGPDERAEERGALHSRPTCVRVCLAAAACSGWFGLEEDGEEFTVRNSLLVESDSLQVDPTPISRPIRTPSDQLATDAPGRQQAIEVLETIAWHPLLQVRTDH